MIGLGPIMRFDTRYAWLIPALALLIAAPVSSQESCDLVVPAALAEARVWCADVDTGQVCLGNTPAHVMPPDDRVLVFDRPGDRVSLEDVGKIAVGNTDGWGVVIGSPMALPADEVLSDPSQLVAFGQTTIRLPRPERLMQVDAVAVSRGANVRRAPDAGAAVLEPLLYRTPVLVAGVSEDGRWVQVLLAPGQAGWMLENSLRGPRRAGLTVVPPDDPGPENWSPGLTDLKLETGEDAADCGAGPPSGLLIQTPDDERPRGWRLNGQAVWLAGTLFARSAGPDTLVLYTLEGRAVLGSLDDGQSLEAGLMATQGAEGAWTIAPYPFADALAIPTGVLSRPFVTQLALELILTPIPDDGSNPIASLLVSDPCTITVGRTGANLRTGPGIGYPIRGVMAYRETARPVARAIGEDGAAWWQLAPGVWIQNDVTVTGGDCLAVETHTE
jgi:hypothetical protein